MDDISKLFGTDTLEDELQRLCPEAFLLLLKDHTTDRNIFWATGDYEELGKGYESASPIVPELITGEHGNVITPRVLKNRAIQMERVRDKAEVFTPSWICNAQNNLIDEAWFGRKDVFNQENEDRTWRTIKRRIPFAKTRGKTWRDYVRDTRLEITCGEAPYLVSRYDSVTGEQIALEDRIGLLDRKLRVVSENTPRYDSTNWLQWAQTAYMNTYGYEWQGDSLLIARENLFITFIEYFYAKFHRLPQKKSMNYMAYIISWNLWQMDGLKFGLPGYEPYIEKEQDPRQFVLSYDKMGVPPEREIEPHERLCLIKDWSAKKEKQKIRFIDLMK